MSTLSRRLLFGLFVDALALPTLYAQSNPCEDADIRQGLQYAHPDIKSATRDFPRAISSLQEGIKRLLGETHRPECRAELARAYIYLGYSYLNLPYALADPKTILPPFLRGLKDKDSRDLLRTLNEHASFYAFQSALRLDFDRAKAAAKELSDEFSRDDERIGALYRRRALAEEKAHQTAIETEARETEFTKGEKAGSDDGYSKAEYQARKNHEGRWFLLAASPLPLIGGHLHRQEGGKQTDVGNFVGIPYLFAGIHHDRFLAGRVALGLTESTGLAHGLRGVGVVLSPAVRLDIAKGIGVTGAFLGHRFRTGRSDTESPQGVWGIGIDFRLHPWPLPPKR